MTPVPCKRALISTVTFVRTGNNFVLRLTQPDWVLGLAEPHVNQKLMTGGKPSVTNQCR